MKATLWVLNLAVVACLLLSCATLSPNAEAFVVRVEQTQTAASATFDFILHLDHADRGFWRTNAPAFHNTCEWMRTPTAYGSNSMPRIVVVQLNVDDLKLAYKASRTVANSNALYSAWTILNGLVSQASSWSNIVTTPAHP